MLFLPLGQKDKNGRVLQDNDSLWDQFIVGSSLLACSFIDRGSSWLWPKDKGIMFSVESRFCLWVPISYGSKVFISIPQKTHEFPRIHSHWSETNCCTISSATRKLNAQLFPLSLSFLRDLPFFPGYLDLLILYPLIKYETWYVE